jgi:hypothetical protein
VSVVGLAIDCVGHPTGAQVRAAGYRAIALYVGTPGRRKAPSAEQVSDYLANGLELILVYEDTTGSWRGGRARGVADAQAVKAHLADLGLDWGRVGCVYFAFDEDVVTKDLPLARAYADGCGSVVGVAKLGVYGGRSVISDALDRGYATFGWSAAGWQYGHIDDRSQLYQQVGTTNVGGVQCDVDQIRADNYGQYPAFAPPQPSPAGPAGRSSEDAVALISFPATDYPADPAGGRWQDLDPAQWPRSGEVHSALVPAVPGGGGWRGNGSVSSITCGWAGGQEAVDSTGRLKPSGFLEYLRVFYFTDITYRTPQVKNLVVNAPLIGNLSLPAQPLPGWCTFLVARYAAPGGLHLGIEYER